VYSISGGYNQLAPTGGVPEYGTSREGGTEYTIAEGVESGASPYAGPSMEHTRPLTDYYTPQALIGPEYTEALPAIPQGPNPYANTLGVIPPMIVAPTAMPTNTSDCGCKDGNGCGDKLPWYVLVGLVVAVVLLLRD
jgi:hypothetical protein